MSILDVKGLDVGLPNPILRLIDSYATTPQIKYVKHTRCGGDLYIEIGFESKDAAPFLVPNPEKKISHMRLVPEWRCVIWRERVAWPKFSWPLSRGVFNFCVFNPRENLICRVRDRVRGRYYVSHWFKKLVRCRSTWITIDRKVYRSRDLPKRWSCCLVGLPVPAQTRSAPFRCPSMHLYSDWTLGQTPLPVLGVQQLSS